MELRGIPLDTGEDKSSEVMPSTGWRIDKTVNLPFLATVALIGAAAVAFSAKTSERLDNLERSQVATATSLASMAPRIERIDQRGLDLETSLNRFLNKATDK